MEPSSRLYSPKFFFFYLVAGAPCLWMDVLTFIPLAVGGWWGWGRWRWKWTCIVAVAVVLELLLLLGLLFSFSCPYQGCSTSRSCFPSSILFGLSSLRERFLDFVARCRLDVLFCSRCKLLWIGAMLTQVTWSALKSGILWHLFAQRSATSCMEGFRADWILALNGKRVNKLLQFRLSC